MENNVYLGNTSMTHGIKGELKFYSELLFLEYIDILNSIVLIDGIEHTISSIRPHKNHFLVTFDSLKDINLVENFRNKKIYITRDELKKKGIDFLYSDLIDLIVYDGEKELGKVKDIRYNKGGILLEVENFLIPYQENFVDKVNIDEKKIMVKNVEGLLK